MCFAYDIRMFKKTGDIILPTESLSEYAKAKANYNGGTTAEFLECFSA